VSPDVPVAADLPAPGGAPAPPAESGTSLWKDAMRRLRRNRLAIAGAVFLVLLVFSCFVLPWVAGLDEEHQDTTRHDQGPSAAHWFGTDSLGRDYLARVLVGGQISLLVGLAGTFVVVVVGTLWGAVAGYYGGKTDEVMMRFVDFMYGIPYMLLVVLFMLLLPDEVRGKNPVPLFAALGLVQWLSLSRIVRGQVMSLRGREYVQAARVMGAGDRRILFRHILPNCLGPIVVYATLTVPSMILLESFLSFLGLGVNLSWGILVADGVKIVNPIQSDWWLLAFPSAFLFTTLLSLNFLGDGLRDALDPRTRR
jgi:oligopeptide transport system permease protein